MDVAVDEERGRLHVMPPGDLAPVRVDQHEICRGDFGPVETLRVDEEALDGSGHRDAEMIAHAFAEAELRSPAQRRGKVGAQFEFGLFVSHGVFPQAPSAGFSSSIFTRVIADSPLSVSPTTMRLRSRARATS